MNADHASSQGPIAARWAVGADVIRTDRMLTPDQQKAFVAVSKQLFPRFSTLVKDQVFFDKTLSFVGKK